MQFLYKRIKVLPPGSIGTMPRRPCSCHCERDEGPLDIADKHASVVAVDLTGDNLFVAHPLR